MLREKLRCKEIWVVGADHYRNPDDDLPQDFEEKRASYYQVLEQPEDARHFIATVQQAMQDELEQLNKTLPHQGCAARGHRPRGQRHLRRAPSRHLGRGHLDLCLGLEEIRRLGPKPDD